jgi:hypothetical protein
MQLITLMLQMTSSAGFKGSTRHLYRMHIVVADFSANNVLIYFHLEITRKLLL